MILDGKPPVWSGLVGRSSPVGPILVGPVLVGLVPVGPVLVGPVPVGLVLVGPVLLEGSGCL